MQFTLLEMLPLHINKARNYERKVLFLKVMNDLTEN